MRQQRSRSSESMGIETEDHEAVREAGERYGSMAADLCIAHVSLTSSEEAIQGYIHDLARNIREQALQRSSTGLGEALAAVWKDAALKAAQARLAAFDEPQEAPPPED